MFGTMYKRELMVGSRNLKTPAAIIANNCVLAFVAIFSYYLEFVSRGNLGQTVKGSVILNIYSLLGIIEFGVVLVAMLLLTVPCVLKERKNHSFDLLISAGIQPMKFLLAKLMARVTIVMCVIFSGCPILGIVYYIGGVSLKNMLVMMIVLAITSFYIGAIGILCSSYCKRNITATVCAYLFGAIAIIGTLMIVSGIYLMKKVSLGIDVSDAGTSVSIGNLTLLLLINPLYNFLRLLNEQLGTMKQLFHYVSLYKGCEAAINTQWVFYSCTIQLMIGVIMIWASARRLKDKKKSKRAIFK